MHCFVFDVDGVLVNPSRRYREALRRSRGDRDSFWELFLSPSLMALDEPRQLGINLLLDRLKRGRVVIVTGRPERLRRATINQLSEFGVPVRHVDAFLMREDGDFRKEWDVKPEILRTYVEAKGLKVIEIHDDEPRTLEAMSRIFPEAKLYLHKGRHYMKYVRLADFL